MEILCRKIKKRVNTNIECYWCKESENDKCSHAESVKGYEKGKDQYYKKRTFCPFWRNCKNSFIIDCKKQLTKNDEEMAEQMKKPISKYLIVPRCHKKFDWDKKNQ